MLSKNLTAHYVFVLNCYASIFKQLNYQCTFKTVCKWGHISKLYHCLFIKLSRLSVIIKQWPLAGEFGEFEYLPKIRQIFVTRSGEFGEYWANFCDLLRRIWQVLSEFGEFGEFGKFGKFGEGRLDHFIQKNIFFCI